MITFLQVRPHHPPPDSSIFEIILWLLTNPGSWWPLIQIYVVEIIVVVVVAIIIGYVFKELSKFYILKEVYCVDPKDQRNHKKIGRQLLYVTKKTPFFNQKLPDDKPVKAMLFVRDNLFGKTQKIYIPKDVKVSNTHPKKTAIMRANIKHDYNRYKGLIPTNETFEAISPSSNVFKEQMDDKIVEADSQVSKSINCNPDVAKHQRTSGSIPLSASSMERKPRKSKIMKRMKSFAAEEKEKDEDDEDDKKPSSIDGLEDLKGELSNV